MTGVILAGGKNRRIPLLKGHLRINGRRIIDSAVELLGSVFDKVVISTNTPEFYFSCGVPMIGDTVKEEGPVSGILSVLSGTGEDAIFAVACDMPYIKRELIRHIVGRYEIAGKRPDAVVPVFSGTPQPFPGIYTKNIISIADRRLGLGMRGLKDMLSELNVLYINEDEVKRIDPDGMSFVNINTMEDYLAHSSQPIVHS